MASQEIYLTREELLKRAEDLAQRALQVSAEEAWKRVQAGQYEGSLLASKLAQIYFLLEDA